MALDVIIVRLLVVAAVGGVLAAPGRAGAGAGLAIGFYKETCPNAEELVLEEMRDIVHEDRSLGPALLRLLFHDCFVRGCDGSIMLKSRSRKGERDAIPMSVSLRGFDEIDRIKAKLEDACPLTVSCADIIIMAARDAVHLTNGPRFPVETGRRDGKVSSCTDAENDLAPPNANIVDLCQRPRRNCIEPWAGGVPGAGPWATAQEATKEASPLRRPCLDIVKHLLSWNV